jgi:hypothetical protein
MMEKYFQAKSNLKARLELYSNSYENADEQV